ncbi:amino acid adenylation domain-containing protein [Xenorhabdus bovienii]|uniref:non-ribosomal peptide synthetase n=1 Tax=Xenorhabdus bovienii TaxID=40576 RepID=UPI0023B31905|nr:non-ribosomal peptide synthetase [Xenorhabdus bovienii]MDE9445560.1 amino acid adenylation domain-containing protein [Xenorhabdus bovienii]
MNINEQTLDKLRQAVLQKKIKERIQNSLSTEKYQIQPRTDPQQALPLSWAQQRLWFLAQLDPAAQTAYHIPAGLHLQGQLNQNALQATLDSLVARHEILRTTIAMVEGKAQQIIGDADGGFALTVQDLSQLPEAEQQTTVEEYTQSEASHPFDFEHGPLIRGRLLKLSQDSHILLLTQHHIISDGWSINVLMQELSTLYHTFDQGLANPLPPLTLQYADYALWQRQWLQGEVLEKQLDYWCSALQDAPALLTLPTDRPRPAQQSYAGGSVEITFPATLKAQLKTLGQRHGTTLFMTLLAGWAVLLSRISGQKDLVIGTPVANRQHRELEPLLGFFVNTLALRVQLHDNPTVSELLAQVKAHTLSAYVHQDLPFEQLVEALKPPRSLSHSPIFQVMLSQENTPGQQNFELPGLTISELELPENSSHFDLSLSLNDSENGLVGGLEYARDLFDPASIERMVGYLTTLLTAMTADDTLRVEALPLLMPQERTRLLVDFNETTVAYPNDILLHQMVEQQVERTPDAIALIWEDAQLSYAELNQRANQLAHTLIDFGIQPDDRVAICAERSPDMIIGMLGILKAGAGYIPLDTEYPAERLAYILSDSAPKLLLTQQHLQARLAVDGLPVWRLDDASHLNTVAQQPTHNPEQHQPELQPQHLAYIIYTSGSTGLPKGVMIEHRNVVNFVHSQCQINELKSTDRVLQFASVSFDTAVSEVFPTLSIGATLILRPAHIRIPDAAFSHFLQEQRISIAELPTAFWHQWVQEMKAGRSGFSSHLRSVTVGGEKAEHRHFVTWQSMPETRNCRWLDTYGPTETTVIATALTLNSHAARSFCAAETLSIGRPIANTRIYILDTQGQPVPIGVAGEIYIGGTGVARGYLNRPELTAERFVSDPFSEQPHARMYRTGDLGCWRPDGTIVYLGRNDFQIKIRGFRIELGEIEAQLADCPGVSDAVVVAREEGAGDKRLVAYLVPKADVTLDAASLREQLSTRLMEHMLPSAFVMLEAFPLNPNGKVDRKALPAPDRTAIISREYQAPQGETEQQLAAVWQNLLGLEQIGRQDNFFELGGHSLLVVSLIEQLRLRGLAVSVSAVFSAPTLAAMAAHLTDDAASDTHTQAVPPNLIPDDCHAITPEMLPLVTLTQDNIDQLVTRVSGGAANIQDIYPLGPLQEGILFHHMLETTGDTYLDSQLMTFDSRQRLDAFLLALQQVIDRHDILRSAVHWHGQPEPVQVVYRQAPLPVIALALSPEEDAEQQLRRHTDSRFIRMDVTQAPLMSANIAKDPHSETWLLSLLHHHLVCDHLSLELIFNEVQTLLLGQGEHLQPALPYRNFIAQTRSVPVEKHQAYFQQLLGDVDEPTLPFGLLDVQASNNEIAEAVLTLDDELAQRIRDCARQQGVSAAVLFHVAWAQVLAQCSNREDVVFGTVLLGRLQGGEDTTRVLGMFINTLPVRITLQDRSVRQTVQEAYQQLSQLLAHEQAPLAVAQRCSGIPVSLPLFNSLLNFRHSADDDEQDLSPAWEGIQTLSGEERSNYPLSLDVDAFDDGFALTAQCSQQIDPARINAYMDIALKGLVAALQNQPEQSIQSITILPSAERSQLLTGFNDTAVAYPQDKVLPQLFEQQVEHTPDAIALIGEDTQLSYAELNQRANQLAHALIAFGVQPDDRVAICIERNLDMVIGMLGILKAGAGYVPLDPEYPAERLAYILSDSAPKLLLTQQHLQARLPVEDLTVWQLDEANHLNTVAPQPTDNPDPRQLGLYPHHLAYIIYTSGSTGLPKGVMIEHHNVVNFTYAQCQNSELKSTDRVLQFASISFDTAVSEIFPTLAVGATLILRPAHIRIPDATFSHFLQEQAISVADLPTAFWHQWIQEMKAGRSGFSSHLRSVTVGGEKAEHRHFVTWQSMPETRHCRWIDTYGPTETTVSATALALDDPASYGMETLSIGHPLINTYIYILDTRGQPVPIGVTGEIYIGGAGVARGYLNRPELTAERFVSDPFSEQPHARMYRTGDLGCWRPDGTIVYLGRNDFQVKIRGFRIELGEIENQLAACAGVSDAVVVARKEGAGDKRLVAYLVPKSDVTLDAADLREQLSIHLAEYMQPSAFVILDTFPLNPNGKLDRKALPAPDHAASVSREFQAPQGETEQQLATVWQTLLGLEQVGRHDNFFELGGHSLLVVSLIEQLRQRNLMLDVSSVFSSPTLAAMAVRLTASDSDGSVGISVPPNLITDDCQAITPEMLPLVALTQTNIDQIVTQVPDGISNIQDIYPLGPLQEGILFHHLLETEGDTYLDNLLMTFDSRQRLDAFLPALQQVFHRHDILRSAILWDDLPQPVQVVYRQAPIPVTELTLSPEEDAEQQLRHHVDPRSVRMDITQAPLMSASLAKDPHSETWFLALLHHHLVCDHQSLEMIFNEVQAIMIGQSDDLPPSLPYRNFIAQTRAVPLEKHQDYFRQLLGDVDEPTLPFGLQEVYGEDSHIIEAEFDLDASFAQTLRECARQQGVSAAVLFHVAWAQVLAQCSGRDDVVFGTVLLGRLQGVAGADQTLGMFMNTLPIRIKLSTFNVQQVVQQTYRLLSELLEHEQAPLAMAQNCSGVTPPLPLFSSLLNYRHNQDDTQQTTLTAWEGIGLLNVDERTNYPLSLSVDDTAQGFTLVAQCVPELDPMRIIHFMNTVLQGLVESLKNSPEQTCLQLNILPQEERTQLLRTFNNTREAYPQDQLIHQLIEQQVERSPTATALIYDDNQLSYDELNRRANQLAHYLIAFGVRPDDRVAICVERGLEMVIGLLAIMKAGAGYIPLDPEYPAERLSYMLSDSQPSVLLTQHSLQTRLSETDTPILILDSDEYQANIIHQSECNLPAADLGITSRNLAYVLYTSGSTGRPKGVMVEHIGVVNLLLSMKNRLQISVDDTLLTATTIGFDVAALELYLPLCNGSTCVIAPSLTARDPEQLAELIAARNIKVMQATPTTWRMLLDSGWTGAAIKATSGGEALPHELAQRLKEKVSGLWNLYGPTETTICSTASGNLQTEPESRYTTPQITIGRPIANTQIYILDKHGHPVPMGVAGEIHIGGIGVTRGYFNRPDLTAERFVHDPFSDEADTSADRRMYKTGDLGRWLPDGNIDYLGRNDFQVKIRGFRIELGEIEARLLACADIREAVVMVREDTANDKRLVAYLVLQPETSLNLEKLRETLQASLASYMVPNAFVTLDSFPQTPNGKLDRQALPLPDDSAVIAQIGYEAPVGETENIIADVWQESLGLERVGRHDHFFELGGHSLLTLQVVVRLRQALGMDIAIRDLLIHPTISELAAYLQAKNPLSSSLAQQQNIVTIRKGNGKSSLFLIHPAGGDVQYAYDLAPYIDDKAQSIYGIIASDAFGEENAQLTISKIAEEYVAYLRQTQIQGPYDLAGWSIGGTIAYEMACQLTAAGEAVNFVGLFDSGASYQDAFSLEEKQAGLPFNETATLLEVLPENMPTSLHDEIQRLADNHDCAAILVLAQQNDLLPASENIRQQLHLYHNISVAAYHYIPSTAAVNVTLFRATEENDQSSHALGWEAVIPKERLTVVPINGSHESIMELPHIQDVGKALLSAMTTPRGH